MTEFMAGIGTFFTAMLGWVAEIIEFVNATPMLLIFVIIAVASIILALAKKWLPGRA